MRTALLAHHGRIQDAKLALKQGRLDAAAYKAVCHQSAEAFDLQQAELEGAAEALEKEGGDEPVTWQRLSGSRGLAASLSGDGTRVAIERMVAIDVVMSSSSLLLCCES